MVWGAVAGLASAAGSAYSADKAAQAQGAANEYNVAIEEARANEAARQFYEQQADIQEARAYDASKYGYEQQRDQALQDYNRRAQNELSLQKNEYGEYTLAPYTTAGKASTEQMQALLGLSGARSGRQALSRFTTSPGQDFLRNQQEKALLRNASAIGGLGGGRVREALREQAFGRAQTDYGNYFNRLAGLSGQGQTAASQLASQYRGTVNEAVPDYAKNVPTYTPRELTQGQVSITRPEEKDPDSFMANVIDPLQLAHGATHLGGGSSNK